MQNGIFKYPIRTYLAEEKSRLPRGFVLTEEVTAVTESDELGRTHVRHAVVPSSNTITCNIKRALHIQSNPCDFKGIAQ